jgi:hypothetical protein
MNDSDLINKLGGTFKVARLCDITPQAVSQWRTQGIPDSRRQFLSLRHPNIVVYTPKAARDSTSVA